MIFSCVVYFEMMHIGNLNWLQHNLPTETGMHRQFGSIDDTDRELVAPDASRGESKSDWHQRCIKWRQRVYLQFKKDRPLKFAIIC